MTSRNLHIVLFSFVFYLVFSYECNIEPFYGTLFMNDFSKAGVADWLCYQYQTCLFIIFMGYLGQRYVSDGFIRRVFVAVMADGIISIIRHTIFGYYEPSYMPYISNAIPISYIIYAYFIHDNRTE